MEASVVEIIKIAFENGNFTEENERAVGSILYRDRYAFSESFNNFFIHLNILLMIF